MAATPIITIGCAVELGDQLDVHADPPHIIVEVTEEGDQAAVHLLPADALRLATALAAAISEVDER